MIAAQAIEAFLDECFIVDAVDKDGLLVRLIDSDCDADKSIMIAWQNVHIIGAHPRDTIRSFRDHLNGLLKQSDEVLALRGEADSLTLGKFGIAFPSLKETP